MGRGGLYGVGCWIAAFCLTGGPTLAADRGETLRIRPGAAPSILNAELTGKDKVFYRLAASKGQVMTVSFTPRHPNCYMAVSTASGPISKEVFDGTMDGHHFSGRAPLTGRYTIQLFLIGTAAERGDTCAYRLQVRLSRSPGS